ncbi:MAG: hypothetical protein ACO1O3_13205 [Sphingobium sp.]|jgi:hypothetical protein
MSWAGPGFIVAIIAISTLGWVFTSWIRARHGYPLEGEWGGTVDRSNPGADRKIELLSNENGQLKDQIGRLEERIAVLERIATDRTSRLSDEIDALR